MEMAAQLQEDGDVDARDVLVRSLGLVGLDEAAADAWTETLTAQAVHDGSAHGSIDDSRESPAVVAGMVAMARARCAVDATMIVCVQELLLRSGEDLLAQRGVVDASAMSKTAHTTWRSEVKASVAGELQVALGVGVTEARQLVAVASCPGVVRREVLGALRRGEVHWALVRRFQSRTTRLDVEDAAKVAQALFGTDAEVAAVERLDPDGALESRPWHYAEYVAALDREVARLRDDDEKSAAERRAVAHAARGTRVDVEDDGTATFTMTSSIATIVALSARVDGIARRCRKAGDERTLAQLRADIVSILLLHGTVELPGPDDDAPDAIITPDDIEALQAVIEGTPSGQVELVVPWDALLGRAVCSRCRGPVLPADGDRQPGAPADARREPDAARGGAHPGSREQAHPSDHGAQRPHEGRRRDGPGCGGDHPPPRWVGELRGFPAGWVTPAEAREIALRPGTVFYRILADPADGRCLERTINRYAPDAAMRRQIRAADVYGRGPGCRRPATSCELDHEHEWAEGGRTSETNLNAKSRVDHFRKTRKLFRSAMSPRRDLTWTTLLGQIARTRGHDYRQYFDAFDRLAPLGSTDAADAGVAGTPRTSDAARIADVADLAARRDLANQVLYAALVSRSPGDKVQADDDIPGSEDWLSLGGWGNLSHRDASGARRPGAPAHPVTPEEILGLSVETPDEDPPTTRWEQQERSRSDDTPPPF